MSNIEASGGLDINAIREILTELKAAGVVEFTYAKPGYLFHMKGWDSAAIPSKIPNSIRKQEPIDPYADTKRFPRIVSPLTGVYYAAPNPGETPFVREGQVINPGDPLCIIYTMKMLNKLETDRPGRVVSILGKNGTAVQKGDLLFIIDPNPTSEVFDSEG